MHYMTGVVGAAPRTGRRIARKYLARVRINTLIILRIGVTRLFWQSNGPVFQFERESNTLKLLSLAGMP